MVGIKRVFLGGMDVQLADEFGAELRPFTLKEFTEVEIMGAHRGDDLEVNSAGVEIPDR